VCDCLRRYGLELGMAYQAKDDLLELTGTEERMGKRPGMDLRNGRTTFLTMAYPETDSTAAVSSLIGEHTAAALRELECLRPTPARRELEMIARLLVQRER
jgi:geranylgeranyl pyrophosphate synthase